MFFAAWTLARKKKKKELAPPFNFASVWDIYFHSNKPTFASRFLFQHLYVSVFVRVCVYKNVWLCIFALSNIINVKLILFIMREEIFNKYCEKKKDLNSPTQGLWLTVEKILSHRFFIWFFGHIQPNMGESRSCVQASWQASLKSLIIERKTKVNHYNANNQYRRVHNSDDACV